MLEARNVSLQFGKRVLFDDVNIKFHGDSCYGVIGANGAGKSTFLKILTDEINPNTGQVFLEPGKRMAVLKQNHSEFNEVSALHTTMMGHNDLWKIMKEKDDIYAKPDFSEADRMRASELEAEFAEITAQYRILHSMGVLLDALRVTRPASWKGENEFEGGVYHENN